MENKKIKLLIALFTFGLFLISFISAEGVGVSNKGVKYDSEILDNFNFTDIEKESFIEGSLNSIDSKEAGWVHVMVDVKDTTNIIFSKEDLKKNFKEKVNKRKMRLSNSSDLILLTLSKNEFQLDGKLISGRGFYGNITIKGFKKLLKDERVKKIYAKKEIYLHLAESALLINANDVWIDGYNGTGQTVCVIDSGVNYSHSTLGGCFGSGCKVIGGYDYISGDSDPMPVGDPHGTNVAGIVASDGPTNKGIANGANIVALRACDTNSCDEQDIRDALSWCFDNAGTYDISVVTMSLGGPNGWGQCGENYADEEISDLYSVNIPIIAASGNSDDNDQIDYPACNSQTISVGATYDFGDGTEKIDWCEETNGSLLLGVCWHGVLPTFKFSCEDYPITDKIACFTNRGVLLDLLAPGAYITASGFTYAGTSAATPMVAGAAALLLQKNSSLEPDEIKLILQDTGVSVGSWKRIDVEAALDSIEDPCSCAGWSVGSCGSGGCNSEQKPWTRSCTPSACDSESMCVYDEDCSEEEEGQLSNCTEAGYESCIEYEYGDCDVSIAINDYAENNIFWGEVNDAWDPYVIGSYEVGWKDVDAKDMYYDVDDPNGGDCYEGGCDGTEISDESTMSVTSAPDTASREIILGYDDTASYYCWAFFNDFSPNYGGSNPIYVLNCFNDSDCSANQYCDKSSSWSNWDCVSDKSNGQSCTRGAQCSSGYCDNDGVGLSDDGHCFAPYSSYFDGQENTYCEYSTGSGEVDCDERQVGDDLNKCVGVSFYEEECSSTCSVVDNTSIFECGDSGCSCSETLCDGLAGGSNVTTCSSEQTYFADNCTFSAEGQDRGDNICRNSTFASGCTADAECNGVEAGTGNCSANCVFGSPPSIPTSMTCDGNSCTDNETFGNSIEINCSGSTDPMNLSLTYLIDALTGEKGWNDSWSKRREILIQENSGVTQYNYSVLLNISYDSDMNSNFTDIRFVDSVNNQELGYWVESKLDSNWVSVWVNVPELNASINSTIFLYYGNSNASDDSNAQVVFLLYDDFDATNSSKWSAIEGSQTVSGGKLQMDNDWIQSKENFGRGVIYELQMGGGGLVADGQFLLMPRNAAIVSPDDDAIAVGVNCLKHMFATANENTWTENCVASGETFTTSQLIGIAHPNTSWVGLYIDDVFKLARTTNVPDEDLNISTRDWDTGSYDVDWMRVRKYVNNKPTYVINEESNASAIQWEYIGNHSEGLSFEWNISEEAPGSEVKLRCRATNLEFNSGYYAPDMNITITNVSLPEDSHKTYHKDAAGNPVAWLGNLGNIVLKGQCYSGGNCDAPGDGSLIFRNDTGYNLGFVNATGDMCIISGDCSDEAANCNSPADGAFIIANSTDYVSYVDGEGDLCLVGRLYENVDL